MNRFEKDRQYVKFCAYGFLKNLRFYDAFLLLYFLDNGISYSQVGVLYAAREIIINVFEIPSGIVADTYGRKNALVFAFLAYIISFIVFYYSTNFQVLLGAIVFMGIGDAFRSGTHKGMIMEYLRFNQWADHKVEYYGHTRSWSQRGSAISALVAGFLVLYTGDYRSIFLLAIVPYLLNFVNIINYPNALNFSTDQTKSRDRVTMMMVVKNFLLAIRKRRVFHVINSAALHSAYLKSIKDYIQPIMVQIAILLPLMHTIDLKRKSGLVIGIIYFIIFILSAQASKFSSRLSGSGSGNIAKRTLLFGLATGVVCGLLVNLELWIISLIVFIVIYLVENARKPIMTGLLVDAVPNEILTSVLSAQSFYSTIATSIIAILIGVFADHFGIGISLFVVSTMLIVLTLVVEATNKD